MPITNDTICALATPVGKGGVSVIRVSGSNALPLCQVLTGLQPTPRQAVLGSFRARGGELIDNGFVLYFKAPHSFTGEDVCEFHCHGSPMVVDQVLTFLVAHGARLARPGEFSERAFLNDKLDLTQAEAIADLIDSASISAARHAIRSLQGDFSQLVHQLVSQLVELRAYVEAAMDFADEEIDFLGAGNVRSRLVALMTTLQQIQLQAKQGSLLREGLKVVMAGAPNAGKSTLLNALCGHDVAIVTSIAGTTRDLLQHEISLDGIPVHLTDTAGLRDSGDPVEAEGIRRARAAINDADLVLLLIDIQQSADVISDPLWHELNTLAVGKLTVVLNKTDLSNLDPAIDHVEGVTSIRLSAHTRAGLHLLRDHIKHRAGVNPAEDGGFIARRRHLIALDAAYKALQQALYCLDCLQASELVAEELRNAQQSLDEITGKFTSDDLLGAIFSSFCIGK